MSPLRIGLLAALALAGQAPAQLGPPRSVTIAMSSYSYAPTPILLAAGQPVRLVFRNTAGKGHDFTAPEFFARARLLSGTVRGGKVSLGAGKTAIVDLVPVAGTYPVHCSKFLHSGLGMKSQMVVR